MKIMRQSARFPVQDLPFLKKQLLNWAASHDVYAFLDSNGHENPFSGQHWEALAGAGAQKILQANAGNALWQMKRFHDAHADWLFGALGYDLKNEIEQLNSVHENPLGFPDLLFFQPETVAGIRNGELEIHALGKSPASVLDSIMEAPSPVQEEFSEIHLSPRMPRESYLETVEAIRRHIVEGDLYEMNLCQEFYAEQCRLDPFSVWQKLNRLARAPMAVFFRWHDKYLISASPERFLKKEGQRLLSQPIKGTRRRAGANDDFMREELLNSEKDRAENVMIVDLVRNDLARSCRAGTVRVDELFGIYTFETVHQMISSVSGELRPDVHPFDAIGSAFPPGSMTGAPKVMTMELIDRYEASRRGLYAGAFGYVDPQSNFDFNVLIRTILYNKENGYVSAHAGGAIVFDSIPEDEYEECLVKANALFSALKPVVGR